MNNNEVKEILDIMDKQEQMIKLKEPFFEKIRKECKDYLIRLDVLAQKNESERSMFPGLQGKIEMQLNGLSTTDADYAKLVKTYIKLTKEFGDWQYALREALLRCNMVERYAEDIDLCSCINKVLGI